MVTKSEILKYIMHTPENTNPGIVEGMLDSLGETYNPETIPIGEADVIVKYNNQPIASLSDTGTFALKTGGTRVEHDIIVRYAGGPAGNVVNITNNSSGVPEIDKSDGVLITAEGVASTNSHPRTSIPSGNSKMFLFNQRGQGKGDETLFFISLPIKAEDDLYSVVVNNTPIAYDDRSARYRFFQESATGPITGQTYNVVITDKQA